MNRKAKIFKLACYLNLFAVTGMTASIFLRLYLSTTTLYYTLRGFTDMDIIGSVILLIIASVYVINYYYGIKLVFLLSKEVTGKFHVGRRIVFWIFEMIIAIFYSLLIYEMISTIRPNVYFPLTVYNLVALFFTICFLLGYLSSLTRIFLTWAVIRLVRGKDRSVIEQIGEDQLENFPKP